MAAGYNQPSHNMSKKMSDIKPPFVVSEAYKYYHHHRMIITDFCPVASVCGSEGTSHGGSEQHCATRWLLKRRTVKPERDRAHSASWEFPRQERHLNSRGAVSLLHSLHRVLRFLKKTEKHQKPPPPPPPAEWTWKNPTRLQYDI